MPNWCQNTATINAPKPVIDEIKAVLADPNHRLLDWMCPMPPELRDTTSPNTAVSAETLLAKYGASDWYNWSVENWGTKWDISQPFVGDDTEEDSITFSFDTAWGPPVDAFRNWATGDGRVTYRLIYIETGMGFVGWHSYDGEYFDEDTAEQASDSERYWEMAQEEFGIEPDKEEEPLTEWYVEGAREKGLLKDD